MLPRNPDIEGAAHLFASNAPTLCRRACCITARRVPGSTQRRILTGQHRSAIRSRLSAP